MQWYPRAWLRIVTSCEKVSNVNFYKLLTPSRSITAFYYIHSSNFISIIEFTSLIIIQYTTIPSCAAGITVWSTWLLQDALSFPSVSYNISHSWLFDRILQSQAALRLGIVISWQTISGVKLCKLTALLGQLQLLTNNFYLGLHLLQGFTPLTFPQVITIPSRAQLLGTLLLLTGNLALTFHV